MSLRDAFVAKGLVSKKKAKQVNRALKEERKRKQGQRKKKGAAAAEKRQQDEASKAEAKARRDADRDAAQSAREAHEHVHRVRRIILDNRLGARGPVPFFHRVGGGPAVRRMMVPEPMARDLRAGRAAIAGFTADSGFFEAHVVSDRAAKKLAEIAPESLMHWVRDAKKGLGDPSEVLGRLVGEVDLRARRVFEEDA